MFSLFACVFLSCTALALLATVGYLCGRDPHPHIYVFERPSLSLSLAFIERETGPIKLQSWRQTVNICLGMRDSVVKHVGHPMSLVNLRVLATSF